jgi:hyperosmotically inducible periplasmic protein
MQQTEIPFRSSRNAAKLGLAFFGGLAIGGALMYLLDPRAGTRRRIVLRDRTGSLLHRSVRLSGKFARHFTNKLGGAIMLAADAARSQGKDSDAKIQARVRSTLGRAITHPRAIDVSVVNGQVTLRGTLAPHLAGVVVRATERVRGVRGVENLIAAPAEEVTPPIQ